MNPPFGGDVPFGALIVRSPLRKICAIFLKMSQIFPLSLEGEPKELRTPLRDHDTKTFSGVKGLEVKAITKRQIGGKHAKSKNKQFKNRNH